MDMLLKEMQEMDKIVQKPIQAPKVNEVINESGASSQHALANDLSLAEV
jgi:hypothetical protein